MTEPFNLPETPDTNAEYLIKAIKKKLSEQQSYKIKVNNATTTLKQRTEYAQNSAKKNQESKTFTLTKKL